LAGQAAPALFSGTHPFQPLPSPTGVYPYHLDLASVLGDKAVAKIEADGEILFHLIGDTGGIKDPAPQQLVAAGLEKDFGDGGGAAPFKASFLYLLGDCIYYNGDEAQYYPQFYEPYIHYPAPIMAVPGNHDGDPIDASATTLDGFIQNFCTSTPVSNT
jgi:hypothetical protein